ncbi:MAG: DHHW family protein [Tenericutes bacterium]|nr:DHHW family protein [Mycoplasmatota bacterium]
MEDKIKNILVSVMFLGIITFFMSVNILTKDKDISNSERRKLQQFPKITSQSLVDKTWAEDFNKYAMDQFVERDSFRKIKINLELGVKHNYNDLFLYNDYIVKQSSGLNKNSVINISNKIKYINDTYLNDKDIYYTIVPDKNYYVHNGNLKIDYDELVDLMRDNLEFAEYIDILSGLDLDGYYKTDTHWREEKLESVVSILGNKMGFEIVPYEKETITKFRGVYASQLVTDLEDEIVIMKNDMIENSTVYNYETKESSSVYNLDKMSSLDKYDIYLSGSSSLLRIDNNSLLDGKKLLVFRDSYGSSLIPLLIPYYQEIMVVDTRYISSKILDQYIDFDQYDDVLFIYSTLLINDSYSLK